MVHEHSNGRAVPKSIMENPGIAVENVAIFLAEISVSQRSLYDTVIDAMKRLG
jgi:hypothetical protein